MLTTPCTGLCRLEDQSGFCRGCGRTRAEIAGWRGADEAFRARVWGELPKRRAALGIALYRKNWRPEVLRDFVVASLRRGDVWSAGGAAFSAKGAEIRVEGGAIRGVSPQGALAFDLDASVCAFAAGAGDDESVVLATPRKVVLPTTPGLKRLGPDHGAARQQDRAGILYDLGLEAAGRTICLRTSTPEAIARLDTLTGCDGRRILQELAKDWTPHGVVLTPIGRIETFDAPPSPPDDGESSLFSQISPTYAACAVHCG